MNSSSSTITTYIGAYRVIGTLGKGTFGVVHQAYQPFLDRHVAVKMLRADLTQNSKVEQQFMNEARTIARMRHPNIVAVYEFGTVPTDQRVVTYMVMEYLPGQTLQYLMTNNTLSATEVVGIVEQLAQALDYAHARGVIHRDLKPANILFTDTDDPVIVDFGLAQLDKLVRTDNAVSEPDASTMSGTPAYMAPEQFTLDKIGPAADQYALAVIAYELLSRKRLFEDMDTSTQLIARFQSMALPTMLSLPETLSAAENVIQQALAHNPEDRFASAGDFARVLGDAVLPDRQRKRGLIITDPLQAAQVRAVRQTITGFMWGIAGIVLLVMLFSAAIFLRGYTAGSSSLFVWDGIIVRARLDNGQRVVSGLWPGGAAANAGVQIGDQMRDNLFDDYAIRDGDYTVNGQPRSVLPASWEPHLGDVIARTVLRNGQSVPITYTIDRSWHSLLLLGLYAIPSALAFVAAIWLLRRWGPEPGVRLMFPLLLSASFLLLTQAVAQIIVYMDTVAAHIVLPSLLLFVLMYPEPLPLFKKYPRLVWALYIPLVAPLIEFLFGAGIPIGGGVEIQLVSYIGYALAILLAIALKWIRRDVRYYRSLWWLIVAFVLVPLTVLPTTIINALDLKTTQALFGTDVNVRLIAYSLVSLGSSLAVLLTWIGYHRLQAQIGPSFIMQNDRQANVLNVTLAAPTSIT